MSARFWAADPDPLLRGVVRGLTGFEQREPGPIEFRALPCTFLPVILDLADGWGIGDPRSPERPRARLGSFTAGLTAGPVAVRHEGWARCLQVNLTPTGARRLLGLPLSELANRSVALDDVLGRAGPELVERVAEAPSWEARIALVEGALTRRLADTAAPRPEVAWALGRIAASGGTTRIGELGRELGWSPRRLIARFRDEVGLPPKLLARITRFERLGDLLRSEPGADWARAAAACGYFDQAHLAREVRDLADMTPSELRARSVNSFQEPVAAVA